jgi:hypothetical protein
MFIASIRYMEKRVRGRALVFARSDRLLSAADARPRLQRRDAPPPAAGWPALIRIPPC